MAEAKLEKNDVLQAFKASLPIILGYLVLGIPCGILCQKAGMSWLMVVAMSVLFYSGAGQYMIANMWIAGTPILSMIVSVALVNTRQLLYGSALSSYCNDVSKSKAIIMAGGVTDESFGVNLAKLNAGKWKISQCTCVNVFSQSSWALSNIIGFCIGGAFAFDTAIASFAMTSIFLCLLMMQKGSIDNAVAGFFAILGVCICKLIGLGGPAILLGALLGIAAGIIAGRFVKHEPEQPAVEEAR